MPCFSPLQAFRSRKGDPVVFHHRDFHSDRDIAIQLFGLKINCGQCIGCRIDRSRAWALRCMHEASMHSENCFITLTYAPEHLPPNGTLVLRDFQLFMYRLRKYASKSGTRIRFLHCGEYGENLGRPHYHALLFGYDFSDKVLQFISPAKHPFYISETLDRLWGKGFCNIGDLTFQSAAYVCRYIIKKVNGQRAKVHYERLDKSTGELIQLKPEYITMSLKPGIGANWFKKYSGDCYPKDFVVLDGKKHKIPRYYDKLFELNNPDVMDSVREQRTEGMKDLLHDYTPERLAVRKRHLQLSCKRYHQRKLHGLDDFLDFVDDDEDD